MSFKCFLNNTNERNRFYLPGVENSEQRVINLRLLSNESCPVLLRSCRSRYVTGMPSNLYPRFVRPNNCG